MAYKALYRTYRPQKFSDVIGQHVIVQTLRNAIKNDRVSHAYLFCGPRGTGKTSIARIFAKVLNCSNEQNGEPCNNCETCKEISEGLCPDVIEIDAASNNGVDEIRDLKEKVKFLPAGSKYKIYIIDEVHMLSTSAFNALLKTLEEPPKHVIFILATTEPQKVLSTIISRCQRFDFGTLSVNELLEALVNICEKENIKYDQSALKVIASASEGGLRDAISLLDQAISLAQDKIDEDIASSVTGLVGKEKLIELANAIEDKNISETLLTIQELENSGKEISKIVNSLLGFYRDILLYKSINVSDNEKYIAFANRININKLYYNIDQLSNVQSRIRYGTNTNIYLEVAIIKMISVSNEELDYNKRIQDLEEKIKNGNIQASNDSSQGDTQAVFNGEDLKRLRVLEAKFNNLLVELSKLELKKNIDAMKALKNDLSFEDNKNDQLKEVNSKIDQVLEDVSLLKVTQQAFRNELNNTKSGEVDENALSSKIEEVLKKTKGSVDINEVKAYVDQVLENYEPKAENKEENKEIIERLSKIESNVYKMLAGKLSQQQTQKKAKPKVDERQMSMFFSDEIVDVGDVNSSKLTPKTNFQDLANDEEPLESNEEVVMEENKLEEVDNQEVYEEESKDIYESESEDEEKQEEVVEDSLENNEEDDSEEIEDYVEEEDSGVNYFSETEFGAEEDENEVKEDNSDSSWYSNEKEESNEEVNDENVAEDNYFDDKEEVAEESSEELIEAEEQEEIVQEEPEEEKIEEKEDEVVYDTLDDTPVEVAEEAPKEEVEEEKPAPEAIEVQLDEYERFDAIILERIMYVNAYGKEKYKYVEERDRLIQIWKNLTKLCSPEQRGIADMLAEGELKISGDHEFILTYEEAAICNRVMSRKFKKESLKLIKELLNDDYNYLAVTSKVYKAKRTEFANQYFSGSERPRLTPIDDPELKISLDEDDSEDDMTKRVINAFGVDVKIKNDSEE